MISMQIIFIAMLFACISSVFDVALGEKTPEKSELDYNWEAIQERAQKYTFEENEYATSQDGWLEIYKRQQERKRTRKKICTSMPLEIKDCGGLLGVVNGVPSSIRYPNSGDYRPWECCAWTLVPAVKFASFQMKFQSFGMEAGRDGVKIYFWNSSLELKSEKVTEFGSWISIPAPYVVITFCSDGGVQGGGFGASILGLGTSTDSAVFKPFWLTNPTETFCYPPGDSSTGSTNEIVSVVVQQPNRQASIVSLSVYQIGNDNIKPYNLHCQHFWANLHYELLGRSGGGNSSWATYKSMAIPIPTLVIFKSNSRNSEGRFTISY